MERTTMKALILDYRNNKKLKFREISEILKRDYGIDRDRQAVQGMYDRAMKKLQNENVKYDCTLTADVVNIMALGYNMAETNNIATTLNNNVSYYKVRDIAAKEVEYIDNVKNELVFKVVELLQLNNDLPQIKAGISYKGVPPTEKGFKDILAGAYAMAVINKAKQELVKAYHFTEDREVIKEAIIRTGLNITLADIKSLA